MKLIPLFFLALLFISCDDGDIIVTSFDFNDANLQFCEGDNGYVFFQINPDAAESLSLNLTIDESVFLTTAEQNFALNSTNFVDYRSYNGAITSSYFCNSVPPVSPTVTENYVAQSGIATLNTTAIFDDNDGIPAADEMGDNGEEIDTDNDGIPNHYDTDDDGDNVPTRFELIVEGDPGDDGDGDPLTNPLDTDGDSIPDYLDEDDDGDGVLTRNESTDGNINPLDDEADAEVGPNYLNANETNEANPLIESYISHSYTRMSDVSIILRDITLSNGEENITQETLVMGSIENIINDTFQLFPVFQEN